jgi:hypothetical protein
MEICRQENAKNVNFHAYSVKGKLKIVKVA